jgi:hypothetical protein
VAAAMARARAKSPPSGVPAGAGGAPSSAARTPPADAEAPSPPHGADEQYDSSEGESEDFSLPKDSPSPRSSDDEARREHAPPPGR